MGKNLIIVIVAVISVMAGVLGNLEKIYKLLVWLVRPMIKWYFARKGEWTLKVIVRDAILSTESFPSLLVKVLVEPKKPVILGECELVYIPDGFIVNPRFPISEFDNYKEWAKGKRLDSSVTYHLSFHAPSLNLGDKIRIQIESEGYYCISNEKEVT